MVSLFLLSFVSSHSIDNKFRVTRIYLLALFITWIKVLIKDYSSKIEMAELEVLLYSGPGEGFDDEATLTGTEGKEEGLDGKSTNLSTSAATRAYQGSQLSDPGTHTGSQDLSLVSVSHQVGVDTTPPLISTHTSSQAFSRQGRGRLGSLTFLLNHLTFLINLPLSRLEWSSRTCFMRSN